MTYGGKLSAIAGRRQKAHAMMQASWAKIGSRQAFPSARHGEWTVLATIGGLDDDALLANTSKHRRCKGEEGLGLSTPKRYLPHRGITNEFLLYSQCIEAANLWLACELRGSDWRVDSITATRASLRSAEGSCGKREVLHDLWYTYPSLVYTDCAVHIR
jgi:hypothetical protein